MKLLRIKWEEKGEISELTQNKNYNQILRSVNKKRPLEDIQ